ncbi:MAG TPA: FHA domain-containing protein [Lacipirellulaceae bacterium]|jgi:pSer/pThr/pTyr-binding forkhead associated (FHA) protein|nr:FHA domain-containing protein [Lacipirellulaceae bacterium]
MAERCWIVGSAPDCDLRVESSLVSAHHCRLMLRGEWILVEDLGSTNGVLFAGQRIAGPRIVHRGDPVTLGCSVPLPWPPAIRIVSIGRSPDNDIVIPLDMISGQHALLEQEGESIFLIDMGSTNGTAVNEPLDKITRAAIHPADQVYFGTHRVAASELFKALPKRIRQATTVLEAERTPRLEQELGAVRDRQSAHVESAWKNFRLWSNWLWGGGLSLLCAVLILRAPYFLRFRTPPEIDAKPVHEKQDTRPGGTSAGSSSIQGANIPGNQRTVRS